MESEERRCARCHKVPRPNSVYDYFCNENCQRHWMLVGPLPVPPGWEDTSTKPQDDTI